MTTQTAESGGLKPVASISSGKQGTVGRASVQIGIAGLEWAARTVGQIGFLRRRIVRYYDRRLRAEYERTAAAATGPTAMLKHRSDMALAILHTMDRAMARRLIGSATLRGTLNIIAREILFPQGDAAAKEAFRARFHEIPPSTMVLSPGKACNLHCAGCYADAGPAHEKLEWDVLDRIVWEARRLWGMRFFALSGGEPLAYKDKGKTVLDLAEEHRDCFFMMYTNGTLIDSTVARRLGAIGNLTPAISVEGMRDATDARRGRGVFDQVLAAMTRLRAEQVPFGISMTPTRLTCADLLSDEVLDFYFEQMGAMYGFLFQYMPIGRAITLEMMPTAEQRLWMMQRMWEVVGQKHYFLADFWNSGILADGCISAGGRGGYLHIDWNGAVSPCVFVPYSPVNIREVYSKGGDLNDVWDQPFFARIRAWQQAYNPGLRVPMPHANGNLLRPCPYRDHYSEFAQMLAEYHPEPTDENAREAMLDPAYRAGMEQFERELAELADPIWESQYAPNAASIAHEG